MFSLVRQGQRYRESRESQHHRDQAGDEVVARLQAGVEPGADAQIDWLKRFQVNASGLKLSRDGLVDEFFRPPGDMVDGEGAAFRLGAVDDDLQGDSPDGL